MHQAFDLVTCYRQLQTQQPAPPPPSPPPPQAVQQPPVQRQLYQPSMRPWSAPPLQSPPFWQQLNPAWQSGPSTDFQHQGWPSFAPNLSALNTSGLSTYLDPTGQPPGPTSSTLSTPDAHRPGSWASSTDDCRVSSTSAIQSASTSNIMRAAQHTLKPDPDQE